MRRAAEATRAGFAELAGLVAPGRTERELQVALEAAFLRSGGDFLAFETIAAAGDHSAVLHFSPTHRALRAGDLLLVDAGAEYRGYASDVTRTYPVGGELDARQRLVWETVRRAGEAAIAACAPGVEWRDVHRTAALARGRGDVVWSRVDELLGFGGVRIEQDVLVTDGGCEVLTAAIPL